MISEYFLEKTVKIYSKDKPFMTSKIKRLILKRNQPRSQALSSGKERPWSELVT